MRNEHSVITQCVFLNKLIVAQMAKKPLASTELSQSVDFIPRKRPSAFPIRILYAFFVSHAFIMLENEYSVGNEAPQLRTPVYIN
jgi:hypothetical protein